jgi:hypothetical protein
MFLLFHQLKSINEYSSNWLFWICWPTRCKRIGEKQQCDCFLQDQKIIYRNMTGSRKLHIMKLIFMSHLTTMKF